MTLQTMMTLEMKDKGTESRGFTLSELVVVLALISAMLVIVIPYATRSNECLKAKEECLNMAEAIKYAIDLSVATKRPTRIVIDPKNRSYLLAKASGVDDYDFAPTEDYPGGIRYFGETTHITDMNGFDIEPDGCCLTFDPRRPWPDASLSLSCGERVNIIRIRGKQVEIDESTI